MLTQQSTSSFSTSTSTSQSGLSKSINFNPNNPSNLSKLLISKKISSNDKRSSLINADVNNNEESSLQLTTLENYKYTKSYLCFSEKNLL
jgi:hypothetical protein